jgi:hypothetical protein
MKAVAQFSILWLFILSCVPLPRGGSETEGQAATPYSIISLESSLLEIKYITVGYTKSIPPHMIRKEDSYVYELVFRLAFPADQPAWEGPIPVVLEAPAEKTAILKYDDQLSRTTDNIFPDYICRVEVKKKGKIRAVLGFPDAEGNMVFDRDNPFLTREIVLR